MNKTVSSNHPRQAIADAVEQLNNGNAVAIPTETVYGLAADATNGSAVAKIFELKNRPSFNPLICHVSGIEMAQEYGVLNEITLKLATHFWPGPLTLVVPLSKTSKAHDLVTANLGTIGLRCPKGIAAEIISAFGKPLAAPSANRSGKISPTNASHVSQAFKGTDLLIVDDGPCQVGLESSIVKIDGTQITLLRPGGISKSQIEDVIGFAILTPVASTKILAPGMMTSHYAPNAEMILNCEHCIHGAAWLGFGEHNNKASSSLNLSRTSNLAEAASNLYAYMKQLDASGVNSICVAPIPMEGLGVAINDRLARAAAPRNNQGSV